MRGPKKHLLIQCMHQQTATNIFRKTKTLREHKQSTFVQTRSQVPTLQNCKHDNLATYIQLHKMIWIISKRITYFQNIYRHIN